MLLPPSLNPTASQSPLLGHISVPDHRLRGSEAPSRLACQDEGEYYPSRFGPPVILEVVFALWRWPAPRPRAGDVYPLRPFPISCSLESLNSKAIAFSEIPTASSQPLSQAQASVSMATADAGSRTATTWTSTSRTAQHLHLWGSQGFKGPGRTLPSPLHTPPGLALRVPASSGSTDSLCSLKL